MQKLVFDFIYEMAVNDALNRVSGLKAGDKTKLKNNVQIKEICEKYITYIIEGGEKGLTFYDAVEEIININNESEEGKIECLNFGKIQKLLNMLTKYYYIKYYDIADSEIKNRFKKCGTPMDSIMMTFVYESKYVVLQNTDSKNRKVDKPGFKRDGWSGMDDRKEYDKFQETIQDIIEEKNLSISPIEFDYQYWDKARKVKYDKNGKERDQKGRIKEVKSVWGINNT